MRQIAERKGFRIVGAADIDPAKAGRDLGEVAGVGRTLRVRVSGDVRKAIKAAKPDVVVLCTSSSLKRVLPQMAEILKLKVPIVSTTEELAYPTKGNMKYARAIHQLARKSKVAVLGTGVNPGFVMDALPITLTGVCERVEALRIDRVQDARIRRLPFQQKIGAGLTRDQFQKKVDDGSVRHVGLAESVSMIAEAMGWKLDRITDEIQPQMATETVASEFLAVDPGFVCGIVQDGVGYRDGQPVDHAAHGGVPRRAGVVRFRGDHGVAGAQDEDRRRRPRRHRDRVDRRQFAPEVHRGCPGPAHDARHAAAVVRRRAIVERQGLTSLRHEAAARNTAQQRNAMDTVQSAHLARVSQLRDDFVAANGRLVARLRGATDEAAAAEVDAWLVSVANRLARRHRDDAVCRHDGWRDQRPPAAAGRFPRAPVGRHRLEHSRAGHRAGGSAARRLGCGARMRSPPWKRRE